LRKNKTNKNKASVQILEKYTRTLIKYKVIYGNCGNLTKGKIFMVMKEYQAKNSGNRMPNYAEIMKSLNICVTLYHAYEALIRCGMRAFLNFYEEHINNPLLQGNIALIQIMKDLRDYLGPAPEVQTLPDGTFAEVSQKLQFSSPYEFFCEDSCLDKIRTSQILQAERHPDFAFHKLGLLHQNYSFLRVQGERLRGLRAPVTELPHDQVTCFRGAGLRGDPEGPNKRKLPV
jgi:hypothetical protein